MPSAVSIGPWRRWQRGASSLLLAPLILSFLLALALYGIPQLSEVYISLADPKRARQLYLGLASIALLSTALFFAYLSSWVVMRGTGVGYGSRLLYSDAVLIRDDDHIVTVRDVLAMLCAAAPFTGVLFGFWSTMRDLAGRTKIMNDAVGLIAPGQAAAIDIAGIEHSMLRIAWMIAIAAVLWIGILYIAARLELRDAFRAWTRDKLGAIFGRRMPGYTYPRLTGWRGWMPFQRRWRMRTRMPWLVSIIAAAMLILAPILQYLWPEKFNAVFVTIGPLATFGLALTALTLVVHYVGNGSRRVGLPFILLLAILVLVWGGSRYMGTDKSVAASASGKHEGHRDRAQSPLVGPFRAWLESRADRTVFAGRKYPVFVIAAQGGGIYAATSAADFLAKLQDHCASFTQHVFAISAVSGGALGSALFDSVLDPAQSAAACDSQRDHRTALAKRVHRIVRADHLSGTVGVAVPDVISNLGRLIWHEFGFESLPNTWWGRHAALECSFLSAYYEANPSSPTPLELVCRREGVKPAAGLGAQFNRPWPSTARPAAPALVLNTTRSETGDRVAFAPFKFSNVGDGTLISFAELEDANVDPTLIEAAVTSARFPGMMPAKIVEHADQNKAAQNASGNASRSSTNRRWRNFVDGGYADASGATTALEIYQELRKIVGKESWAGDVDLRLLLLTDAPTVAGGEPRGDGLVHAISPLTTLFSVRGQMARRAVKRAWDEVNERTGRDTPRDIPHGTTNCDDDKWAVRLIMLDQQTFSLPLGWMISTPTADLIDRMIGEPRRIDSPPPTNLAENEPDPVKRAANILYNNSCTMYSMTRLLAGDTKPIKAPAAPITPAQP
jgi:hypothetical protein